MADVDLARVKRNVAKMVDMGAPEADIDGYIASEGTTVDAIRTFRAIPLAAPTNTATPFTPPTAAALPSAPVEPPMPAGGDPGALSTSVLSGGQALTFGFGDELGAALGVPIEAAIGAYNGEDDGKSLLERIQDGYSRGLRSRRELMDYAEAKHPVASTAGTVAGAVTTGGALAKGGLSVAANAAQRGAGLARVTGGSLADGAAMGLAAGAGSGDGLSDRIEKGTTGLISGAALGLATPLALAGAGAATAPIRNIVTSRIMPQRFANDALATAMRRADATTDTVVRQLTDAAADGQGAFTIADALGNSGQRMLSTVARTPNDARQEVVRALADRQLDQGRRVANALSEASGSPMTAAQYEGALKSLRGAEADINYAPVMTDTTPINVTEAVSRANRAISPLADQYATARGAVPTDLAIRAPIEAGEASIRDPIREAVKSARSYLASDSLTVTNVEKAFRAKTNIDQMIASAAEKGQGGQVKALMPIQQELDEALARTSPTYASARDAYRTASGRVDAVSAGRDMAAGRNRIDDNMAAFAALPDDEARAAARVGYFDPKISRAETQAGTMSNSARPFMSESARQELPAFAAPGQADRLMTRLGREQTMFETNAAATGGSKTADNLADLEDMANFDPALIARLLNRDFIGAGLQAVTKVVNEAKGLPPRVVEQVGRALMETDPAAARKILQAAQTKAINNQGRRAVVLSVLNSLNVPAIARSSAP